MKTWSEWVLGPWIQSFGYEEAPAGWMAVGGDKEEVRVVPSLLHTPPHLGRW